MVGKLKGWQIFVPILIGIGVSVYMLYSGYQSEHLFDINELKFEWSFVFIAILVMVLRDLAYAYRLSVLLNYSVWKALRVVVMWEFSSAVSPGVVGGSAVAIFLLKREGKSYGESAALVLSTVFLDNLFYVLLLPVLLLFFGLGVLNSVSEYKDVYLFGYFIFVLISALLAGALFVFPDRVRRMLVNVSVLFSGKRGEQLRQFSNNVKTASNSMKAFGIGKWMKLFASTSLAWLCRFLILNISVEILVDLSFQEHAQLLTGHVLVWSALVIIPLPGGAGISEYLAHQILPGLSSGGSVFIPLVWRLISYYPYLLLGIVFSPIWIKKTEN